jgi:hypothetical protein
MCPEPKPYLAWVLNLKVDCQIDKNKLNHSHEVKNKGINKWWLARDAVNQSLADKNDRHLCARLLCEVQPHGGSYFDARRKILFI